MEGFNTRAARSERRQEVQEVPLASPIWQVADYGYEDAEHYADVINERRSGQVYGRYGNPTLEVLAETIAGLEGAEAGWIFSSGMGAVHATLMHVAGAGDRIVAARTLYGGTYGLFTAGADRVGIKVDFVDATNGDEVLAASEGAAAVFIETVANPTLEVADLETLASLDIPLIVDNTVPTPALLNPIELGADLVLHSTSKYIGGHHDLMGGAVVGPADRINDIRHLAIRYGTTASAFESWLALRGVATLGLRMERHSSNALAVAERLESAGVRVLYPGLPSHPQYERAKRLMSNFGGMVAADLGSQEAAWRFLGVLKLARVGSSFGGVRSETTHPATTSHRQFSKEDRLSAGITDGLVRISIGIEDEQDLLADIELALEKV
jgi:methionine-gamma-lyase